MATSTRDIQACEPSSVQPSQLVEFKHKAIALYEEQKEQYKEFPVNFFSCYRVSRKDCTDCESMFKSTFLDLLGRIEIDKTWNFMDCGCGLGHPLYLASSLFSAVYGVEIEPSIAAICRKNLEAMGVRNFHVLCADIASVEDALLDKINVFFLYNPFQGSIFSSFIQSVVASSKRSEREIWMIYVNAVCEEVLAQYAEELPLAFTVPAWRPINYYHHTLASRAAENRAAQPKSGGVL